MSKRKFNMQLVLVWIKKPEGTKGFKWKYKGDDFDVALNYLKLQVENSIRLGWPKKDIVVITNFPFSYMGVKSNVVDDICTWSAFANKIVLTNRMIQKGVIDGNFWLHDCDLYQLEPFDFPSECKDWGYTRHNPVKNKIQGASGFYRKEGFDIVSGLAELILKEKPTQEETFFTILCNNACPVEMPFLLYDLFSHAMLSSDPLASKSKKRQRKKRVETLSKEFERASRKIKKANPLAGLWAHRFSDLNYTYNFGIMHQVRKKWAVVEHPIKALHFHVDIPRAADFYCRGKNKLGEVFVPDSLNNLLRKHKLLVD